MTLIRQVLRSLVLAAAVWAASLHGLVWLSLLLVAAIELPWYRRASREEWLKAVPAVLAGFSFSWLIALYPRAISQAALAVLYAGWHWWLSRDQETSGDLIVALVNQVLLFETIFLAAAIWHLSRPVCLVLLWVTAFGLAYSLLVRRNDRSAGVLAAAWALITTEAAWVFLAWLVSYVLPGEYVIVPQPTVVLGGLAYCTGSIYLAQRQSRLSRSRLTEYIIIVVVLMIIVVAGTPWRGTI